MDFNPIILSIPIYFLLIVIELSIQFFTQRKIYRLNDAITNISCGITQQVTNGFLRVTTLIIYQFVYENWAPVDVPNNWWTVILLVLGVDFCYYWAHRMSHEVNLFWGGHVVHHQSEDYNFSVALRQGSFQVLWTFWFYLPLAFLGFETTTFLLVAALNTVYQFWIHTETISKLPKPIEYIFNTPSHHRVHHGRNPKYIDKNHAGSLIIWDRMFGTFQKEEETPTYGITKPLNTWNPVWANLEHYKHMIWQFKQTPGVLNKIGVLINKPGWKPRSQGGSLQIPEVDSTSNKYNMLPHLSLSIYILAQFVVVLGISSFFLFMRDEMSVTHQIALTVMIIWSVGQFGIILDRNEKYSRLEYLRILILGFVLTFIFPEPITFALVSILGLMSIYLFYYTFSKTT